jgi:hypothetical protein
MGSVCDTDREYRSEYRIWVGKYKGKRSLEDLGGGGIIRLTLSLLMSYIYGAPSKARNLTSYIYGRDFTGDFAS